MNNQIPDWNDLVYRGDWQKALRNLHSTNNFPEFTGRICPAPCEASCTLNIIEEPVTIKTIECAIVDRGWQEGWIQPEPPARKTGKSVAVVGSGPAGLACAQQLARAGHDVHLYEKNGKPGGLLRYGIPDFKMEKTHIDRRVEQMEAEGVTFHCNVHVGIELDVADLVAKHDAVVLSGGAEQPRDLPIPGRDLDGIHFAMQFLPQQNRRVSDEPLGNVMPILAGGKHVVVIGGGDTGSDCIGTSNRQGALSVTQIEILQRPPDKENKALTWPNWPMKMRTSSSQEEGVERDFAVMTQRFEGENGKVKTLHCIRVDDKHEADRGQRVRAQGRPRAARHGLPRPRPGRHDQGSRTVARSARQRRRQHQGLPVEPRQGVLLRRHAPRPEPGRLGDPRRPPVRQRRRQGADGRDDPAALGPSPACP